MTSQAANLDWAASGDQKPFAQRDLVVHDGIDPPQIVLFPPEKICMDWEKTKNIGVGLHNLGNTCYLNSALQCLTYTPPLANYMLSFEHSQSCVASSFCMMCVIESHIAQALCFSNGPIQPACVISGLKRIGGNFHFGHQEDAHEFLSFTLEALQNSCLNGNTELDRSSQATTFIHQIFGGHLRSRVECMNCKAVSDTYETFFDISLNVKEVPSIISALEEYVTLEELDGENSYKCSKCEKMVLATKRCSIHRTPNVLILSLKRFTYDTAGKINKAVKYPEYLDLRTYMSQSSGEPVWYRLYAVLVHKGFSSDSGHYICYIKAGDGHWYIMNDDSVQLSDIETVLSQQAYLLFYISVPGPQWYSEISGDGTARKSSYCREEKAELSNRREHRKRRHGEERRSEMEKKCPKTDDQSVEEEFVKKVKRRKKSKKKHRQKDYECGDYQWKPSGLKTNPPSNPNMFYHQTRPYR